MNKNIFPDDIENREEFEYGNHLISLDYSPSTNRFYVSIDQRLKGTFETIEKAEKRFRIFTENNLGMLDMGDKI